MKNSSLFSENKMCRIPSLVVLLGVKFWLVGWFCFAFLSWNGEENPKNMQNQKATKPKYQIDTFHFISHDILLFFSRKEKKNNKNIIKVYFSSFLLAYIGGFYAFHVLLIAKDYVIKALWQVRSVEEEAILLKEGDFFFLCVPIFLLSILPSNSAASCQLAVSDGWQI